MQEKDSIINEQKKEIQEKRDLIAKQEEKLRVSQKQLTKKGVIISKLKK